MNELLDTAPCGFLSFGDDGAILMVNGTLLEWLGYERDEVQGRHIDTILPAGSRLFYQTHFFPLLKLHGRAEEIYILLRTKSAESLPVFTNAVRRERNGIAVNECAFIPMRQRRRYEDEIIQAKKTAEAANQAKARFLSMVSHDLRTPLQAIASSIDILSEEVYGPISDLQRQELHRMENANRELMHLINDILNFARLERGQVEIHVDNVSVDTALYRAEALVMMRIQEAGLEYEREGDISDVTVRADPDRLQQVLINLLTNALKFTPRGGRISVTCERVGSLALLQVHDTGPGIPSDQLERIFEPFVQVDRSQIVSSQQGVGLGLAISRELTRAMGGDLTVESEVGRGSTFTIALPTSECLDTVS